MMNKNCNNINCEFYNPLLERINNLSDEINRLKNQMGITCCAGATGPIGPDGPVGPIGPEGPVGPVGATGLSGIDGAPSLRYTLNSVTGENPTTTSFSSCCNINLQYTNQFIFSYNSLNDINAEGFMDTMNAAINNGQIAYFQITQVNDSYNAALYSITTPIIFSDPGNGGQYTMTVNSTIYGNGTWNMNETYTISFNLMGPAGFVGPAGPVGATGLSGIDGAPSLRYILNSVTGENPTNTLFSCCCNINLQYTNQFIFSYNSLNDINAEGFMDTMNAAINNGQIAYFQITQVNDSYNAALYSITTPIIFSDPGNGGQYTMTVNSTIYGNGTWNTNETYTISFNLMGPRGVTGSTGPPAVYTNAQSINGVPMGNLVGTTIQNGPGYFYNILLQNNITIYSSDSFANGIDILSANAMWIPDNLRVGFTGATGGIFYPVS